MGDRLPLFKFSGNIKSLKKDAKLYYESCLNINCKKKLSPEGDGRYRCEKCCEVFNTFKPTFIFTACIQDGSGQLYVTFNSESAEQILGITAEEYVKKEAE
jgi:replication factor A1